MENPFEENIKLLLTATTTLVDSVHKFTPVVAAITKEKYSDEVGMPSLLGYETDDEYINRLDMLYKFGKEVAEKESKNELRSKDSKCIGIVVIDSSDTIFENKSCVTISAFSLDGEQSKLVVFDIDGDYKTGHINKLVENTEFNPHESLKPVNNPDVQAFIRGYFGIPNTPRKAS